MGVLITYTRTTDGRDLVSWRSADYNNRIADVFAEYLVNRTTTEILEYLPTLSSDTFKTLTADSNGQTYNTEISRRCMQWRAHLKELPNHG